MGTKEVRARLAHGETKLATKVESPKFNTMFLRGVGSAIQYITINEYHASRCNGCHTTAKEMDKLTPQEILDDIDTWAEKLHQNAQAKMWNKLLDWVAYSIYGLEKHKELIRRAAKCHVDEVAKKAEYTTQR